MNKDGVEQRNFLLACAAWQDTLLQSYRTLHITIQGFLIAAGSAVFAVQLSGAIQEQNSHFPVNAALNLLFTLLLVCLFLLQRKTAGELKRVVESRGKDIDHWHFHIIRSENSLEPSLRAFTYFKTWQHAKRASVEHILPRFLPPDGISESDAWELIGKGTGHTRKVLDDNLFARLQLVWYALFGASTCVTVWFFVQWCLNRVASAA